jgi:hypothetical protein
MLIPQVPPETSAPPAVSPDPIGQLLNRSREQRAREYQYRFAQTAVFGLPVVGLWAWGAGLDPVGHERWGTVLQALLCGWILYVNAGMVIEGVLLRRVTGDLVITAAALGMFLWSLGVIVLMLSGRGIRGVELFPVCVVLLAVWTGSRWMIMRR